MSMLKNTVDSVTKGFDKMVEDLYAVAGKQIAKAEKAAEKARMLEDAAALKHIEVTARKKEAVRAEKIAEQIKDLVS